MNLNSLAGLLQDVGVNRLPGGHNPQNMALRLMPISHFRVMLVMTSLRRCGVRSRFLHIIPTGLPGDGTMATRLTSAATVFAAEASRGHASRLKTWGDVVERIHEIFSKEAGLKFWGLWLVPGNPNARQHVFPHPSAAPEFLAEQQKLLAQNGPSALAQMACFTSLPFTFAECKSKMQPMGTRQKWVFEFAARHGMRDGLYCPVGRWRGMFYHSRRIEVSAELRAAAHLVITYATARMNQLIRNGSKRHVTLSVREQEMLQALAMGHSINSAAKLLGIKYESAYTMVRRAMKKYEAKTVTQAVCMALRQSAIL